MSAGSTYFPKGYQLKVGILCVLQRKSFWELVKPWIDSEWARVNAEGTFVKNRDEVVGRLAKRFRKCKPEDLDILDAELANFPDEEELSTP